MASARVTVVLLCLLVGASVAGAEELRLPTSPLQTYYRVERAAGAQRSTPLAHALMHVARAVEPQRKLEILQQASLADPALAEPHLQRARLFLLRGKFTDAMHAFGLAYQAASADVVQRTLWLERLQRGAHDLLLGTLAVLALLLIVRCLPFVRHVLRARFESATPIILLAFAPIVGAWFFAPVITVLAPLFLLAPFLRKRERLSLALICASLAFADVMLFLQTRDTILLDPNSVAARVAQANHGSGDPQLMESLRAEMPASRERELLLGMQARRKGDLGAAHEHYVASLSHDSTFAAAYVNLANLFFELGDYERAVTGYRGALSMEPDNLYAHANLAQTYIRMIQYEESDHELRAASALGYERVAQRYAGWSDNALPLIDEPLSSSAVLEIAAAQARTQAARTRENLQAWRGELWRGLPITVAPWILFALAGLLLSPLRLNALAFECSGCSRVCCAHCATTREKTAHPTCSTCAAAATPRGETTPRNRSKKPYTMDDSSRWLAPLFPGAADLARGAPVAAIFTVLIACSAVLAVRADIAAALARSDSWFVGIDLAKVRIAALVFWLAYLPGLLRSRSKPRRPAPSSFSNQMPGA